jgi:Undecaprenyl-phosphate glucose phosphotransferase
MSDTTVSQANPSSPKAPVASRRVMLGPLALGLLVAGLTAGLIVSASLVSGIGYHLLAYGEIGPVASFSTVGSVVALAYLLPQIYRDELRIEAWAGRRQRWWSYAPTTWIGAFAILIVIAFLTKTTALYSRGWALLFFVGGLGLMMAFEAGLAVLLRQMRRARRIAPRRLLLAGTAEEIADYEARHRVEDGFEIVSGHVIEPDAAGEDGDGDVVQSVMDATASARQLNVDDVLILSDWRQTGVIEELLAAFSTTPVAVHVRANGLFPTAMMRADSIGEEVTFSVQPRPLTPVQEAVKRLFDLSLAVPALILLSPLFAVVAMLIKLDSPGPVFFMQKRRGYNLRKFKIFKFRTMTTLDDGDVVVQARRGDPRITRIGRILRQTNIDELPQLLNVVLGNMSIVGPRPHAVAHDLYFEARIAAYPKRLNVRPGITGWAQINGWRGETDTVDKMVGRVERDLYYIDNWSLAFDLYILAMTIFSPRSYLNAH